MPVLMFTLAEVAGSVMARVDALSQQILELSDLAKKPLSPGESPDERRHTIARLGKQLAEASQALLALTRQVADEADATSPGDSSGETSLNPNSN